MFCYAYLDEKKTFKIKVNHLFFILKSIGLIRPFLILRARSDSRFKVSAAKSIPVSLFMPRSANIPIESRFFVADMAIEKLAFQCSYRRLVIDEFFLLHL